MESLGVAGGAKPADLAFLEDADDVENVLVEADFLFRFLLSQSKAFQNDPSFQEALRWFCSKMLPLIIF